MPPPQANAPSAAKATSFNTWAIRSGSVPVRIGPRRFAGPESALALAGKDDLGELHRQNGDFDQAKRYLEQAIELAPTHAEKDHFRRRLEQCWARNPERARSGP
jgi:hypothetical protein